ncbi:hypothetical protein [Aestuariivirga sp.]|uniref:hypothetical protein n=1 Tax=Aestuariivirga sp. TaxID=2650926 RepID=UPI00391B35C2
MTQRPRPSDKDTTAETPERPQQAAPHASWVLTAENEASSREELLARYRRQRNLSEDPFGDGRPTAPSGYRDRVMSRPRPAARFLEREEAPVETKAPPVAARSVSLGQTFAIAAMMALISGGGVGFLNAYLASSPSSTPQVAAAEADAPDLPQLKQQAPQPVQAASAAAPAQAAQAAAPAQAAAAEQATVIQKKPVPTATLQVSDVEGQTNSFIPLALRAEPASLGSDMLLKISGIPEGAYLTSGRRDQDMIWALTLDDLKDVKLVVPEAQQPEIDLAVAAFEPKTGELAAPVKTMTVALSDVVVQPASAPPPQQVARAAPVASAKSGLPASSGDALPAPIPPPESVSLALATPQETPQAQHLVLEGDTLLKSGDVRAARKAYEQAWSGGSAAGAFGIARSHDPVVLGSLYLKNAKPDKEQALQWYERAAAAGHTEAAAAIVRLRLKP